MSVLGFDIRDYTDPNRILEESLAPQPPLALQSSGNDYAPPVIQQAPPVPQQAPVTVDNATGQQVTAPAGINPAATQQPPAAPIPGTASPAPQNLPASIKPMEGVTNDDRIHAMAMVLGAVGQNNFSQMLGAAQTGLMEKEINAREYNDKLTALTQPQYAIKDGKMSFVPAQFKVDSDGNFVPRSEKEQEAEMKKWLADNPSLDHPGGATGFREQAYIDTYRGLDESEQLAIAAEQGVDGRVLNDIELLDRFSKNSAGLAGAIAGSRKTGELDPQIRLENYSEAKTGYRASMEGYEAADFLLESIEEGAALFGYDADTWEELDDAQTVDTGAFRGRLAAYLGIGSEQLAALENMNLTEAMEFLQSFKGPTTDFEFGKAERGAFADIFTSEEMNVGRLKQLQRAAEREQARFVKQGDRFKSGMYKYGREGEADDYLSVYATPWRTFE